MKINLHNTSTCGHNGLTLAPKELMSTLPVKPSIVHTCKSRYVTGLAESTTIILNCPTVIVGHLSMIAKVMTIYEVTLEKVF